MKFFKALLYIMMVLAIMIPLSYEIVVKGNMQPGTLTLLFLHSWNVSITTLFTVFSCCESESEDRVFSALEKVTVVLLMAAYFGLIICYWDETLWRNVICSIISALIVIKFIFVDMI